MDSLDRTVNSQRRNPLTSINASFAIIVPAGRSGIFKRAQW
jgi:hypothetical protein